MSTQITLYSLNELVKIYTKPSDRNKVYKAINKFDDRAFVYYDSIESKLKCSNEDSDNCIYELIWELEEVVTNYK